MKRICMIIALIASVGASEQLLHLETGGIEAVKIYGLEPSPNVVLDDGSNFSDVPVAFIEVSGAGNTNANGLYTYDGVFGYDLDYDGTNETFAPRWSMGDMQLGYGINNDATAMLWKDSTDEYFYWGSSTNAYGVPILTYVSPFGTSPLPTLTQYTEKDYLLSSIGAASASDVATFEDTYNGTNWTAVLSWDASNKVFTVSETGVAE